ncbi:MULTISPECIES: ParB N-terminal domain-containing protein [Erysipelotrichaceae]|uniref:ParB N-terminal domain-containing protein n=1 Tax=Erysipelotrichaceae TaxID=128827 RepID=UPI001C3C8E15|nr:MULTISPECIES: ParB N-terminal domain-containing protein [Erysipelotrichaceae]
MSSLLDLMSGGVKFEKVSVTDIRPNPRNFYGESEEEEAYVEAMAQLIQENGQESNGVVYEQSGEDGKHYTLLSGERRLKAITKNYEEGKGDGLMDVKVVPQPQDDADEYLRLIRNNAQRNKSKQIREKEVEIALGIYNQLAEQGQRPAGKKREWIGAQVGLSPRQVQSYLKALESAQEEQDQSQDEDIVQESKRLTEHLTDLTGHKTKITKSFAVTIKCQSLEGVQALEELLEKGANQNGVFSAVSETEDRDVSGEDPE